MNDYEKYKMVSSVKVRRSLENPTGDIECKRTRKEEILGWVRLMGVITVITVIAKLLGA